MDHHVPRAVTEGLRRRGVDVVTAHEDGSAEADDERLLDRATELGRILYPNDKDFLAITPRWLQERRPFAGVVYAQQGTVTVGKAIEDLELVARASDAEYMRNRVEYLPL